MHILLPLSLCPSLAIIPNKYHNRGEFSSIIVSSILLENLPISKIFDSCILVIANCLHISEYSSPLSNSSCIFSFDGRSSNLIGFLLEIPCSLKNLCNTEVEQLKALDTSSTVLFSWIYICSTCVLFCSKNSFFNIFTSLILVYNDVNICNKN